MDCIPKDIVLALAHDLNAIVAVPILQYSPLLSDADLIEVIARGQVQEALTAIARRRPVSEAVGDMLVQSLDVPAVAALLVNPDARIRKETMDRIVEQAEEIESWHMPLVLRADLSARAIRRIGSLVGAGLIEKAGGAQRSVGRHPHPSEPRTARPAGRGGPHHAGCDDPGRCDRHRRQGRPAGRPCSWNRRRRRDGANWSFWGWRNWRASASRP